MAGQTSYTFGAATPAFAGQLGDSGPSRTSSYLNDQGAQLPAGIFVALTADGKAKLPVLSTDQIAGCVINQFARNAGDSALTLTGTNVIAIGDNMSLLEEGAVWVLAEQAMAVTDKVFVRYAAGTGTQLGAVRKDADTATARRLSGARVLHATSAAGPCLVYFSASADASNL